MPFIIAGLAWFLLRTDAGVAVRAAAENADRALLLGIPIRRLSTIVWAIAGGLATLTFMLKAPFAGAAPSAGQGITVLLPALAAAVVARMESLPIAFGAGIGLGIMESVVRWNSGGGTRPSTRSSSSSSSSSPCSLQRGKLSRAMLGDQGWSFAVGRQADAGDAAQPPRGALRQGRRSSALVIVLLRLGAVDVGLVEPVPRRARHRHAPWPACRS